MNILRGLNKIVKEIAVDTELGVSNIADKFGETITPNMRALRLSMTVADYLLSMGVPVSDVVGMSLDITDRYCKKKVAVDISSNVLMFSQDRGIYREPLTLIRTTTPRAINISLIQAIEELAHDIHAGNLELSQAEERLSQIISESKAHPQWLANFGGAAISGGVGALLSGSFIIILITFIVGWLISESLYKLAKKNVPPFFIQVFAAALATLVAAAVTWLGNNGVDALATVNPNLIIIGGIVMLVAGLDIVGAVEDAIDEYYVTANARILRVFMMTLGIVAGVVLGLYVAKTAGVNMAINIDTRVLNILSWQYIGAAMIAGGYALYVHGRIKAIAISSLIGILSWAVFVLSIQTFQVIVASFLAATAVGAIATLISRWQRTPSTTMITAGIIPLVPGLALFQGLMLLVVQNPEAAMQLESGAAVLLKAVLIALAIAAGATFGNLITRPIRRTIVRAQNVLPSRITKL